MAKNTKQSFEFNRTERLRRTIFLEDSSEDESLEYTNRTNTSNYSIYFQNISMCVNNSIRKLKKFQSPRFTNIIF